MERDFKMDLFRGLKPGDKPLIIDLGDIGECTSYSTLGWRYNTFEGKEEGKYVHVSIDYKTASVYLICTTYEEYEKEQRRKLPRQWWKTKIKSKKKATT